MMSSLTEFNESDGVTVASDCEKIMDLAIVGYLFVAAYVRTTDVI